MQIIVEDLVKDLPIPEGRHVITYPLFDLISTTTIVKSQGPQSVRYLAVFYNENNKWVFKGVITEKI